MSVYTCLTTPTQSTFFFGFCLQVFRRAVPPMMKINMRQMSFSRTQERIASPGFEPGFSNVSAITNNLAA